MVLSFDGFDGFATSLDGTHDWMFEFVCDDSGWNQRALDQAGTHAMGRPRPLPLADHGRHPRRTRHRPDHRHRGPCAGPPRPPRPSAPRTDRGLSRTPRVRPDPRLARPRAYPRRVRAHELAAAPRHPGYRPPRRDGLTGLCESCNHAKHSAGWHSRIRPGRRHGWRPPPLPATPTDPGAPATWPAAPPLATTGSTSCSAPSSGSPPERRRCRRPRLASDPWQPCCPSCS